MADKSPKKPKKSKKNTSFIPGGAVSDSKIFDNSVVKKVPHKKQSR